MHFHGLIGLVGNGKRRVGKRRAALCRRLPGLQIGLHDHEATPAHLLVGVIHLHLPAVHCPRALPDIVVVDDDALGLGVHKIAFRSLGLRDGHGAEGKVRTISVVMHIPIITGNL